MLAKADIIRLGLQRNRKPCQPNLEMSSSSQSRNVRFMASPSWPVLFAPVACVCATDGPASA